MRILLLLLPVISFSCASLNKDKAGYKKAYIASYEYIEETINLAERIDTLKAACLKLGANPKGFQVKLHVSKKEIPNDVNLVLCDYIKKRYNVPETCAQLFGESSIVLQNVRDSIAIAKEKHKELNTYSISKLIPMYVSKSEKGYILFFSKISGNTLSAELISFCDSYKESRNWYGASKVFYFTFNQKWEIEEVFNGKKHYR